MIDKRYIGDGVYVAHDGYHVWLTTNREDGRGGHQIALEPAVLKALDEYRRELAKKYEAPQYLPTPPTE